MKKKARHKTAANTGTLPRQRGSVDKDPNDNLPNDRMGTPPQGDKDENLPNDRGGDPGGSDNFGPVGGG